MAQTVSSGGCPRSGGSITSIAVQSASESQVQHVSKLGRFVSKRFL